MQAPQNFGAAETGPNCTPCSRGVLNAEPPPTTDQAPIFVHLRHLWITCPVLLGPSPLGFLPRHTTIVDRTTEAMVKAHERQDTMARCVRHRVKRAFESSLFKVISLSIYQQPHPPSVKLANCDSFPRIGSMQLNASRPDGAHALDTLWLHAVRL